MKYQIKSDKGYYSRSMSTGKAIFLDSSEMGYTFTKEDAERMLERLQKETGKDLEIVEYKPYYDDGGEIVFFENTKFPKRYTIGELVYYEPSNVKYNIESMVVGKTKEKIKIKILHDFTIRASRGGNKYGRRRTKPSEFYNDKTIKEGTILVVNPTSVEDLKYWNKGSVVHNAVSKEFKDIEFGNGIYKKHEMAKGGEIYNFDVYLYNDDEDRTIKEKKRYQVKASNRSNAYDKAKTKFPKPYFVELYSVDSYADGGSVSDSIAMTILKQLGGINKLVAMTGAYNFVDLGDGVAFKIKNQKANYIKITLNSMDLYDLEVGRIRADTYKVIATHDSIYFDQLKPLIEKATGMYLSLFANGGNVQEENDVFDAYVPPTPEEKAAQQQKKAEMAKMAMMFIKDGAEIPYDKLYELDIDKLDMYERMKYDDLINRGISKEDTINVLINDTDGDYSQLSPELNKYVKWYKTYYWRKGSRKSKFAYGGITEEMKAAKNILGQESWNRMSEDEKLNATKYLIRKGQIEGGREEYQYDNYPYAKGGRVRFQQNISNR